MTRLYGTHCYGTPMLPYPSAADEPSDDQTPSIHFETALVAHVRSATVPSRVARTVAAQMPAEVAPDRHACVCSQQLGNHWPCSRSTMKSHCGGQATSAQVELHGIW